jgi:phosphoribosylaminoimidazole carboxylase (NCAIR synthetase)
MKIKYVLFICGGKWQIPWIQYLKYKGHKIIIVDPYSFSPAVPLADIHIACDAKDIETIYSKIISENFEIEFVTSDQTDVSTNTVALLSEKLGLIGNKPEIVKFFSNKFENRSFLKKHFNSHYPKFIKAYNKEEIITFFNSTSNNIIIKPVDAQSSRGIFKIDDSNLQHIQVLYDEAVSFSQQNYVIAEEFVIGKEITVEGICIENRHYTLATSSKNHFRTGIASELRYPAKINHTLMNKIYQFHNRFIEKTGLNFGITHSEYIVNNEETDFWLVEAACRAVEV